jgi:hypothetical protein
MPLRSLRIRCTAKVDARTIGRLLNALGAEVGMSLRALAIGWSGLDTVQFLLSILFLKKH